MAENQTSFRSTLLEISDQMGAEDLKTLKFFIKDKPLKTTDVENIKTGLDVFNLLEEIGQLGPRNTDELERLLTSMNLPKTVQTLQRFKSSYSSEPETSAATNVSVNKIVKHFKSTEKLKELKEKMKKNFVTLKGLLGSGKSEMALKYGCDFQEENKQSIVWKLNCKDLTSLQTSLKDLCTKLGLKVDTIDETKATNESIQVLTEKVLVPLENSQSSITHLILLDDVTQETCQCLKVFIRRCTQPSCHTKLLATTFYPIFDESEIIEVKGFTEEEAIDFLSEDKISSNKDISEYRKLAKELSCLPLGLYCARTYMRHTHSSPGKFNKLCATSALTKIEDSHCIADDPDAVNNKTLFKALLQFIGILKKNENRKVFEMILSLQFLEIDDIPIILFDFYSPEMDYTNQAMETNNFIQAIQTFSFGKIEGEDDDRFLSTHSAVTKALKIFTDQKTNNGSGDDNPDSISIIKQLLKAFMYLMDKDNRSPVDFQRNKVLVQHAKSVLNHADKLVQKLGSDISDIEFLISLVYVHDLVGYTYNFDHIQNIAAYHSDRAKYYTLTLLGINREGFEKEIESETKKMKNVEQLEVFSKNKAEIVFEAMKKLVKNNAEKLEMLAKKYILNKHRVEDDISALSRVLDKELEREKQLNDEEYNELCKNGYAVPLHHMKHLFLYEIVLSTLYTHGRRIFYLVEPVDDLKARVFCAYLYISFYIGQCINNEFPQWKCLYAMLTERSGTLQQAVSDCSKLEQSNTSTYQKWASRCEEMLQEDTRYYVFGIFKTDTKDDEHYQAIWLKQLIRFYGNMLGDAQNHSEKENVMEKGKSCASRLQELLLSDRIQNRTPFSSLQFCVAELFECMGDTINAEGICEKLTPKELLSKSAELTKDKLHKYDKKACMLLIKCLYKNSKKDTAKDLYDRLTQKLELSQDGSEQKNLEDLKICLKLK